MKRMARIAVILLFLTLSLTKTCLCAQELVILRTKGKVFVRNNENLPWHKAQKGDTLFDDYELQTKRKSECTFGVGKNIEQALTLKANSYFKITNLTFHRLELVQGRVFSLIKQFDDSASFEIRTPTAITGARGTGWSVESGDTTSVRCYEGEVYVQGLDESGQVTSDQSLAEGNGVNVSQAGEADETFELTEKDKKEWMSVRNILKDFVGKPIGKIVATFGSVTDGAVDAYLGSDGKNPYNR